MTAYLQRVRDWKRFEQVTAASWLRRALGKRAYDRTFGAQLRAKFGRYHDQVAMVWFWGKIWLRTTSRRSPLEGERLGYFQGSFNTLIDALAAARAKRGADADRRRRSERADASQKGGVGRRSRRRDRAGRRGRRHHAISCARPPGSGPPQRRTARSWAAWSTKRPSSRCCSSRHPLSDIYWLNIADDDLPFTGVIEQTNFISPDEYGGKRFVYLSKYLEPEHPYFAMSDEELIETYIPFLRRINPAFDRSWIERSWVFRERSAQPIIPLNYGERIPDHRTGLPGLYLANTTQIYPRIAAPTTASASGTASPPSSPTTSPPSPPLPARAGRGGRGVRARARDTRGLHCRAPRLKSATSSRRMRRAGAG